ncbi:MAG: cob(I)yrinic acid a,c-diamide adenosyltransferase [Candidatus Pacebacteria bacterium]|jgi:cob(I)alamin adenosyltransferase|nr:cob(I)yrinic acid a,c-diamide adenosyltransferase [Candidatus Paceibacterota bacterium]|tara:strand:- start:27897 stop:28448 length:552 start_codon:yes stop_codon:yes gene_type:complete
MLYTRKGDKGDTELFACDQRISKSSATAGALGAMDETNSYIGLCKVKSKESEFSVGEDSFEKIVHNIQKNLFIIQAELAGATESISEKKVKALEKVVDDINMQIPEVESFFISGGCELSAMFDYARTLSRRAERRVVAVQEEEEIGVSKFTLQYLNRLSSVLYALARLSNHRSGIKEQSPDYK